ncbi:MAG: hypothetical protein HWN67_08170 [Candidatus Helarchaeota archaeon]|nr:hypothetical protein [Candidatus Helarchaeota archaeon]
MNIETLIEHLIFLILFGEANRYLTLPIKFWMGFLIFGTIAGTFILFGHIVKIKEGKFFLNLLAIIFLLPSNFSAFILVAFNYIFNIIFALILFFLSIGFSIYTINQGNNIKNKRLRSEGIIQLRSRIKRAVKNILIDSIESGPISRVTQGTKSDPHSKVHLDDSFIDHSKPLVCPICNYKNPSESRLCISCYSKFLKCSICKKQISKEDEVFCPFCSAPYHKRGFFEWLKVKAHCKNCKKDLDLWEFQKYHNENGQEHDLPSKFCINCRRYIPIDANFCIYCGFKI